MTSRERIASALEHRQPDKVPVDFGGSAVSGISASMVHKLRKAYNLPEHPIKVVDCYQMLGEVEEDLREKLGSDCVLVTPYTNLFGFRNAGWKPWALFDGTPVLVPGDFNTSVDSKGGLYQYPQGDSTVPPSGYMPKGGYYFDALKRGAPVDEDDLSLDDNLEEFSLISEEELKYAREEAGLLRSSTDCAVIASLGGTALGDIAFVPATFLKHPKGIRDIEEWYVSMASRQDFLKEIFDRQTRLALKNLALFKEAVGDNIDVLYLCGADFGNQNSPMCSTETFANVYLPYYRRMIDWIHRNTNWKVFKHCCGSIRPLIPKLIEAGFDILNPVQNSARDMDPRTLKDEFGGKIAFWGGGVDTQHTLPYGTPDEVFKQVTERIQIYNRDGGFVFNTIHNTQSGVPVENFLAMIDAVRQFR
ncbi:MAG: methyltransferase [Treponema sp.]|jgi:uroporphyrinogen-III decarboxylase|nr:methyltransferase [Treponema sp.]